MRARAHRVLLNETPAAHPSAPSGRRRPGNGGGVSVRSCPPCDTCHKIVETHAPRGIPQLPAPAHVHKLKIPSLLDIPAPPAPIVPPADTTCHKTPNRGPAVTMCPQPGARATPSHRLPPHMLSLGNPLTFFNISQQEAHPAAMKKPHQAAGLARRISTKAGHSHPITESVGGIRADTRTIGNWPARPRCTPARRLASAVSRTIRRVSLRARAPLSPLFPCSW